jgi:hypothetical protein
MKQTITRRAFNAAGVGSGAMLALDAYSDKKQTPTNKAWAAERPRPRIQEVI